MSPVVTLPPLARAIRAVEKALTEHGVGVLHEGVESALHRVEYEFLGQTLAAVGWTDELQFVRHPHPEIVALVRAHANLDGYGRR
jgi:hypothetical protein